MLDRRQVSNDGLLEVHLDANQQAVANFGIAAVAVGQVRGPL
jgi:hypothetical protein